MRLKPEETDLLGKWAVVKGEVVRDATSDRIETLTEQHLEKIAGGGWETLFRDPGDGRYWERTYPESSWHGGGPPRLTYLSNEQARAKYGEVVQ
jgi:immunity protein 27 of polymorphic toxin system